MIITMQQNLIRFLSDGSQLENEAVNVLIDLLGKLVCDVDGPGRHGCIVGKDTDQNFIDVPTIYWEETLRMLAVDEMDLK